MKLVDRICTQENMKTSISNQTNRKKLSLIKSDRYKKKKHRIQSEEAWNTKIKEHDNYAKYNFSSSFSKHNLPYYLTPKRSPWHPGTCHLNSYTLHLLVDDGDPLK